jgi:protein-disulfide isomerase
MNNKLLGIFLAVLVGIAAGLCFLFSVSTVMNQTVAPLSHELQGVNANLRAIQTQLASSSGKSSDSELLARLKDIEQKLSAIESGGGNRPPAPPMPPQEDFNKVHQIDISKSYVKGNKNAPVTIVEFTDFQCPFCNRFHAPLQEAISAYPKDVKLVIKNFPLPFHPQAKPAAKAALAAGEQGKYFEMADLLLANQQSLSDDKYKELAKQLGLNVKKFETDLKEKDAQYEAVLAADMALVEEVDVRGTPTFFINGKKTMARDAATWKQEIEKLLKK